MTPDPYPALEPAAGPETAGRLGEADRENLRLLAERLSRLAAQDVIDIVNPCHTSEVASSIRAALASIAELRRDLHAARDQANAATLRAAVAEEEVGRLRTVIKAAPLGTVLEVGGDPPVAVISADAARAGKLLYEKVSLVPAAILDGGPTEPST